MKLQMTITKEKKTDWQLQYFENYISSQGSYFVIKVLSSKCAMYPHQLMKSEMVLVKLLKNSARKNENHTTMYTL